MTISVFLSELADKLERGPANVAEYKMWANECRTYATIANLNDYIDEAPADYLAAAPAAIADSPAQPAAPLKRVVRRPKPGNPPTTE